MFDDYSLEELKSIRRTVTEKMLSNAGIASFSLPDGVSLSLDRTGARELLTEINRAITRKTSHGGPFVEIHIQ
ncbi:MAG: hypothetical protein LBQ54_00875 [Planctomycetaceae bacterium]|jgi:hypothetical protein|nr:hypothetical protein [Planctomycetaceae bacterium]